MKIQSLRNKQDGVAHLALLVVAILVVVGGIGAYILTKGSKKNDSNNPGTSQQSMMPFTQKTANTPEEMKSMMTAARNGNYAAKCTFTDDSGNASYIYIAKDRMRVDTTINKKAGHMVWTTDKAYIWADGDTKGSILPVTNESSSSQQTDKFADSAAKYKMSCQTQKQLDDSLFKIPTNVKFTDFNVSTPSN